MIKAGYRGMNESSTSNVINVSRTGMSMYDNFLDDPEYMKIVKGMQGSIVQMSPDKYIEECISKIFKSNRTKVMGAVDSDTVTKYAELMKKGEKFPLPVLDYARGTQEGRHRVLAAKELGISKVPVLLVTEFSLKMPKGMVQDGMLIFWKDKDGGQGTKVLPRDAKKAQKLIDEIAKGLK